LIAERKTRFYTFTPSLLPKAISPPKETRERKLTMVSKLALDMVGDLMRMFNIFCVLLLVFASFTDLAGFQ
jgi:hypothetical protein